MKNLYESIFGDKSKIVKDISTPIIQQNFKKIYGGNRIDLVDGIWTTEAGLELERAYEDERKKIDKDMMPTPPLKCNGIFFGGFNLDGNLYPELSHIITTDIFIEYDQSTNLSCKNTHIEINDPAWIKWDGNKKTIYSFDNVTIESNVKHNTIKFNGGTFEFNNVIFKGFDTIVFNDYISKKKLKGLYNSEVRAKMNSIFILPESKKKITGLSILKDLEASYNKFYDPNLFLKDAEYYNINPSARVSNIFPWIKNSPEIKFVALNVICSINYVLGDDVYIYLIKGDENTLLPLDMHKAYSNPGYRVKDINQYEKLKTADGWYVIFYGR